MHVFHSPCPAVGACETIRGRDDAGSHVISTCASAGSFVDTYDEGFVDFLSLSPSERTHTRCLRHGESVFLPHPASRCLPFEGNFFRRNSGYISPTSRADRCSIPEHLWILPPSVVSAASPDRPDLNPRDHSEYLLP